MTLTLWLVSSTTTDCSSITITQHHSEDVMTRLTDEVPMEIPVATILPMTGTTGQKFHSWIDIPQHLSSARSLDLDSRIEQSGQGASVERRCQLDNVWWGSYSISAPRRPRLRSTIGQSTHRGSSCQIRHPGGIARLAASPHSEPVLRE